MSTKNTFDELAEVNARTWGFWKRYLAHCLRYTPFFFREAPVYKWWDFLGSTHRVAWDIARADCALEAQPDIWTKGALRGRFLRWADNQFNDL